MLVAEQLRSTFHHGADRRRRGWCSAAGLGRGHEYRSMAPGTETYVDHDERLEDEE